MVYPCLDCRISWSDLCKRFGTADLAAAPESDGWRSCYAGAVNDISNGLFPRDLKLELMVTPLRGTAPDLIATWRRLLKQPELSQNAADLQNQRDALCKSSWELHQALTSQLEEGSVPFRDVKEQIRQVIHVACTDKKEVELPENLRGDETSEAETCKCPKIICEDPVEGSLLGWKGEDHKPRGQCAGKKGLTGL